MTIAQPQNPKAIDEQISHLAKEYARDCGLTTWPMTDSAAVLVDAFTAGYNKGISAEAEAHKQTAAALTRANEALSVATGALLCERGCPGDTGSYCPTCEALAKIESLVGGG